MNTIIKLAPGNIGWYDEVTGIHLTLSRNTVVIKPGMNTTNIRRAIKDGKVQLLTGSLEQENIEPIAFVSESMDKEATTTEPVVIKETEAINYNKESLEIKSKKTTKKAKK